MHFKFNLIIIFLVISNIATTSHIIACGNRVCNNTRLKPNSMNINRIENQVSEEDKKWANDLSNNATGIMWQSLKENFEKQEALELTMNIRYEDTVPLKRPSGLYIFVSTSMSKSLLKTYINEARKYRGILVLRGLPNNSFKELSKLITELMETKDQDQKKDVDIRQNSNFQIDDEAFDKFNITSVPTIVLSKENEYFPNQKDKVIYDKIIGNVGIKYALRQFSESGELQIEAKEHLNVSKNK